MVRPGVAFRPRAVGTGPIPVIPVTPEMLAALAQAIAGGVTQVDYADRSIKFMSLDDLLRAYDWLLLQLGVPAARPVRRGACFSKGLEGAPLGAGVEHQEVADALFSRGAHVDPQRTDDIDWERAR